MVMHCLGQVVIASSGQKHVMMLQGTMQTYLELLLQKGSPRLTRSRGGDVSPPSLQAHVSAACHRMWDIQMYCSLLYLFCIVFLMRLSHGRRLEQVQNFSPFTSCCWYSALIIFREQRQIVLQSHCILSEMPPCLLRRSMATKAELSCPHVVQKHQDA